MSPPSNQPPFSSAAFRAALGAFATGVTLVTCTDADGNPVGLTVNSFSSVSLTPPLILWSLGARSVSRPAFESCTHFVVNVLAAAQVGLARRFASSARHRWDDLDWHPGSSGAPLIAGAAARFECRVRQRQAEGDHILFIGQVAHCDHARGTSPLLFHGGRYYTEHELRPRAATP